MREPFLGAQTRICGNAKGMRISPLEAIDIDTSEDWELAELVALGMQAKKA